MSGNSSQDERVNDNLKQDAKGLTLPRERDSEPPRQVIAVVVVVVVFECASPVRKCRLVVFRFYDPALGDCHLAFF